jgi:hypothetical protein
MGHHIAASADVTDLDAVWLDEVDDRSTPMGSRGIGEIGIVGAAAAIANAVYHATGTRVRSLPVTPDKLITRGAPGVYGFRDGMNPYGWILPTLMSETRGSGASDSSTNQLCRFHA